MLNAGEDEAAVLQALALSEATYLRWRKQYGDIPESLRSVSIHSPRHAIP